TIIGDAVPLVGIGHSAPVILSERTERLQALMTSFVVDYLLRQKLGGVNLTFNYFEQIAVPSTNYAHRSILQFADDPSSWIDERVVELFYTSGGLERFADGLAFEGAPFRWDEERRRLLRAELDAAFFHLYGVERQDVDYVMETFPIVKKKDVAAFGSYRTKELILEVYDAMTQAIHTGERYKTILDPPPGQGPRHPESSRSA
ncbi:SAM-dependent DNA methyltransferase, partial [Actinomadura geliboluensis]